MNTRLRHAVIVENFNEWLRFLEYSMVPKTQKKM